MIWLLATSEKGRREEEEAKPWLPFLFGGTFQRRKYGSIHQMYNAHTIQSKAKKKKPKSQKAKKKKKKRWPTKFIQIHHTFTTRCCCSCCGSPPPSHQLAMSDVGGVFATANPKQSRDVSYQDL